MPKIEPAVRHIAFQIPAGVSYVDLAAELSKINRRLYRQGMVYAVESIQLVCPTGMKSTDVLSLTVSAIPNSWIAHNSWRKGFATWRDQQNEFMEGAGRTLKGKWSDFKVHMDDTHAAGTTNAAVDLAGDAYVAGEWVYSNFVYDDAGTTRSPAIHMIGTSTDDTKIGLIQAYGESRNYPASGPDNSATIATGFYAQFNTVDADDYNEDLGTDIRDQNDLPPYDQDQYPGGHDNADHAVPIAYGTVNATQSSIQIPGGIFPCGLMRFDTAELSLDNTMHVTGSDGAADQDAPGPNSVYTFGAPPTCAVIVTLAAGPYRGVLATSMGQ